MQHESEQDTWKRMVGEEAVTYIENGMVVGIGTGTTAAFMIQALARRLRAGLTIVGAVPTSRASAQLASSLGIPLTDLDTHPVLDLAIDGADEIDSQLRLIKGGGGALLREKIVATSSRRFIIIADTTKLVPQLGDAAPLPVETIPFAMTPVRMRLQALGAEVRPRQRDGQLFRTDSGNIILDCFFANHIADPETLDASIQSIVGVVETGLFLGLTERAIIGGAGGIQVLPKPS
ncbi:MAG TPA: ribose-5-phosphate isomerase RpiA [Ktedonobacteraceae bacterium]|nr:ribose-5-phosphate isomerase RpiA [Ktedonobacteraceae bacterium]